MSRKSVLQAKGAVPLDLQQASGRVTRGLRRGELMIAVLGLTALVSDASQYIYQ